MPLMTPLVTNFVISNCYLCSDLFRGTLAGGGWDCSQHLVPDSVAYENASETGSESSV